MKLLAIAYPVLKEPDFLRIETFREKQDRQFSVIRAHFTLIFPFDGIATDDFSESVAKLLTRSASFSFSLQRASVHKDLMTASYYLFLVPSLGNNEFINLYSLLNEGRSFNRASPLVPFIPHITIGTSESEANCNRMADEWNSEAVTIQGTVDAIDILKYENNSVTTLKKCTLARPDEH